MTKYKILKSNDTITVDVSGHSGYGDVGYDIVCASISTALIMTANEIDNLGYGYNILNLVNESGKFHLEVKRNKEIDLTIKTLEEVLQVLTEDFPNNIKKIY
jgi:uncharacterized protein YsxB (DUF464 family)